MRSLPTFLFLACSVAGAFGQISGFTLTSPDLWTPAHVPFSFTYGGKESAQLLPLWKTADGNLPNTAAAQLHRYSYTDPVTKLTVNVDVRRYADFPDAVDWIVRFRNDGSSDTPILENILAFNWAMPTAPGQCVIRHAKGSYASADDFQPLKEGVSPGGSDHLEASYGDPSSRNTLPFFNLQTGDGGLIGAIGWTGDWKADFDYAADGKTIRLTSGMKQTHLLLHPGEEIRTPRIVLLSWTGANWQDSQNVWRRLLLAHYTLHDNGQPMRGPILFGSWGSEPIAHKLAYINWVHEHQIPVEVYAVDAGWYGDSVGAETDPTNPWWKNRGDWFPSKEYYPHGIKPLGEALKADGFGFSLWIEPETSMPGKQIIREHPDWFLHSDHPANPGVSLANLGNPTVRKGITAMVSNFITNFDMTWYRQDFNILPERYWQLADTPDRIGMTEIAYVEGLYKMWDDLLAQHPGLHIDNCASGGRRIDIEMMSRSFVVWRTDHGFSDTIAEQAQTQALAPWVPENMAFESYAQSQPWKKRGPYSTPKNLYLMRLAYDAGYGVIPGAAGVKNDAWVHWIKQALAEYREVQPYFYGDFYALLPYSQSEDAWTAWQWNRPQKNEGLVIVLRRPRSRSTELELDLKHLDAAALYQVEVRPSYSKTSAREIKGSDLAHFKVELPAAPSSTLLFYRRK